MNEVYFQSADWYRATSLKERINSISLQKQKFEFDTNLAQQKMQKWGSQIPFDEDSFFTKRLEIYKITETEFLAFLGEPSELVKSRFPNFPGWLQELEQAFSQVNSTNTLTELISELQSEQITAGFLYAVEPLINRALNKLDYELQTLVNTQPNLPFDLKTIK
ncbi:MAG: hypothetical protein ACRDEA_23690, partial [Microcystaceae cyanobacterium]